MELRTERRGLIAYNELDAILDDQHWLAYECAADDAGGLYWKELICAEGEKPLVVTTQRNTIRIGKTVSYVFDRLRKTYPDVPIFEIPAAPGEIAPRKHPQKSNA